MFGFGEYQECSLWAAAQNLACYPWAQDDEDLQRAICEDYGIIFDEMTEDERQHLYNLANEFMGE